MKSKVLAITLIVGGIVATLAGLFGQVVLREDEGHHDGRTFSFALADVIGTDALIVETDRPNTVGATVERVGQPMDLEKLHDATLHLFLVGGDLSYFAHVSASEGAAETGSTHAVTATGVPAGEHRVVVQASPSGGPDLLELGATVEVEGDALFEPQNITADDEWTDGALTVRRQGFDFVLSEPWSGENVYGGPAFLSLFRADDLAFTHAHADVVDGDRFSFAVTLPGSGEYLAALEFEQDGEMVTALFRLVI